MSRTELSKSNHSGETSPESCGQPSGSGEKKPAPPSPDEFLNELLSMSVTEQVEKMAALFFSVSDISLLIGMPVDELRRQVTCSDTELSRAYRRGSLQAQIKLRYQDMVFAKAGSPQALENMLHHLSNQKQDENA